MEYPVKNLDVVESTSNQYFLPEAGDYIEIVSVTPPATVPLRMLMGVGI